MEERGREEERYHDTSTCTANQILPSFFSFEKDSDEEEEERGETLRE